MPGLILPPPLGSSDAIFGDIVQKRLFLNSLFEWPLSRKNSLKIS